MTPALHAWARLRIPRGLRGRVEPEDVVQEVWCRALARITHFDPARRSFRAWIFGVAKNVVLEAIRSPLLGAGGTSAVRALAGVPDRVTGVSRRVARDEALQRFHERIERLEDADRRLLIHCGFEDLTCAEAAERLGISRDAAIKRWQRLRARLTEEGVPEGLLAG